MRRGYTLVALLLLSIITASLPAHAKQDPAPASGRSNHVDLVPRTVGWGYPSTGDVQTYGLVSPIQIESMGKGIELAAVEGMRDVQMRLTITIENMGDITAVGANVTVDVIHNEYSDFIIASMTQTLPDIGPKANQSFIWDLTPTYSGTHTLRIAAEHIAESNPSDNVGTIKMRIGSYHTGFPNNAGWILPGTGGWSFDSTSGLYDPSTGIGSTTCIAIGAGSSGSGQNPTGSYASNLNTSAVSPPLNLPIPHPSPNEPVGLAFIYSGMVADTDHVVIDVLGPNGVWHPISGNLQALSGTTSWSITSTTINSASNNIIAIEPAKIHEAMQMRFRFVSDSSGEDIGMYFDELVVLTEEKARFVEYDFAFDTLSNSSAEPGGVTQSVFQVRNTGNLTETFSTAVTGLPGEWEYSIHYADSGTKVPATGITLAPNEQTNISVATVIPANESNGIQSYQLTITSDAYANLTETRDAHLTILEAGRVEWLSSSERARCLNGTTCTYSATLLNPINHSVTAQIEQMSYFPPTGWTLSTSPALPLSTEIPPQGQIEISIEVTVPPTSVEGQLLEFQMGAKVAGSSTNNTAFDLSVDRGAESIGEIGHLHGWFLEEYVTPLGGQTTVPLTVWNNGSSISDFIIEAIIESGHESSGWSIVAYEIGRVTIGSGMTHTAFFTIDSPSQGFAFSKSPSFGAIVRSDDGTMLSEVGGLRITLGEHTSANVITPAGTIVTMPLQNTEVYVYIENTGNHNSSAQFNWTIPLGWEYIGEMIGTIELPPAYSSQQVRISLNLSPPLTANANSIASIEFNLKIRDQSSSVEFSVGIGSVTSLIWETNSSEMNEILAPVGRATSISTLVTNIGNDIDDTSAARLSISPENVPVRFFIGKTEAIIGQWQDLEVKSQDDIELIFDVWPTAEHLGVAINVTLSIQSWNLDSQRQEETSRTWTINPVGAPLLTATFTGGMYNLLSPSGTRSYKVTIDNTGTIGTITTINAELIGTANGWQVSTSHATASVEPGESVDVWINVTAPSIETSLMNLNVSVLHDGSDLGSFSVTGLTVITSIASSDVSASGPQSSARLIDPLALGIILAGVGILMIGAFLLLGRRATRSIQTVEDEGETHLQHQQQQTQSVQSQPQVQYAPQAAAAGPPIHEGYSVQGSGYPNQIGYPVQANYPSQGGYSIQNDQLGQQGTQGQQSTSTQAPDTQAAAFAALGVSTGPATTQTADQNVMSSTTTVHQMGSYETNTIEAHQTDQVSQITSSTPIIAASPDAPEVRCITCLTPITNQQNWVPCSSCGQYHHWACSQSQPSCRYCHQLISKSAS